MRDSLSGRLAVPHRFEDREVAEKNNEERKNQQRDRPIAAECTVKDAADKKHAAENQKLNQHIERQREKPAADSSDGEFECGLLRCFNGNLVGGSVRRREIRWWQRHDFYALA